MKNCELAGNVIKPGVETLIAAAEQKIGELLHENGRLQHQAEQFKTVYMEFNNLLCHIGYEGSVDADSRYVWDAMQALGKIDGGIYSEQFAAKNQMHDKNLLTATKVANYLKKHLHGDNGMFRNGFFEGAKWSAERKIVVRGVKASRLEDGSVFTEPTSFCISAPENDFDSYCSYKMLKRICGNLQEENLRLENEIKNMKIKIDSLSSGSPVESVREGLDDAENEDVNKLVNDVMQLRKNPPNGSSWY